MLMTQTAVTALAQGQRSSSLAAPRSVTESRLAVEQPQPARAEPRGDARRERDTLNPTSTYTSSYAPNPMNGIMAAAPPGAMYVRALYDYEADDRTSLSFHEGDVIQVITQLESGWWDGVINGVRGWFPSNYCEIITSPDELPETEQNGVGVADQVEEEVEEDVYEEGFDDEEEEDTDDITGLPLEGTTAAAARSGADFWIPQATQDGRLFYFNTMTGERSAELPLESPTSGMESGPLDRMNVNVPERTRPPPELMARGLTQDEDEDSEVNSASELEGETILMGTRGPLVRRYTHFGAFDVTGADWYFAQANRRSFGNDGVSPAVSMESMNGQSPGVPGKGEIFINPNIPTGQTPMIASATSFTATAFNLPTAATMFTTRFEDGPTPALTWSRLVSNMKKAIDRYRDAITSNSRSEYVARAEDISDHLRLLLAAGSGTTDNHSGQPSIISTNKALYPHFRDMMSKFSKLVISSHIAAADWPNAESVQKCLQEADGVLLGVFSYVEVARQQRGEEIPRLFPGFVIGTSRGGSWQNNGLGPRDPMASNFLDDDEGAVDPTAILDGKLLERLDEHKRMLVSSIRELDKNLVVSDKVITPFKHEVIGNNVCTAGGKVLEMFKPWIAMIESIDLSSLGNSFQTPQLADFSTNKQSLYDNVSDLLLGCQAVAGPLADEWTEVRGEALENRLEYVRQCARALETNSSHIGFSLQLLSEQVQINLQQMSEARVRDDQYQRDQLRRGETMPYGAGHQRSDSRGVLRPQLLQSQSYSEGDPTTQTYRKGGDYSKLRKLLGEDPTAPQGTTGPVDETPEFLRLDYENELSWDIKLQPAQIKGGSLFALVEQLTRHDKLDSSFNNTFLLTYRSFTSARELFELLVKRFNIQPPEGLNQGEYEQWRDRKQKLIRFRVVNIIKNWFDNFWLEDSTLEETKTLIRDVYTFARDTVKSTETPGSAQLMAILEQRLNGKDSGARRLIQTLNQNTPAPIMPKNMKKLKFLDIDVTEFARQLTIVESRLYGKIKPTECLNKTWQKKISDGEPEPAPNVRAIILHSNQMTNWVAEMILAQTDVKKRVVVIKHFVAVADVSGGQCPQLRTFFFRYADWRTEMPGPQQLLDAYVHHLGAGDRADRPAQADLGYRATEDAGNTGEHAKADGQHQELWRVQGIATYGEPSVHPFLRCVMAEPCQVSLLTIRAGVYLTDLTFIEDGIPSIIKKTNLINFAKRAKTAEVIRDIQQYQNVVYSLQPVTELQDYILSNMQAAGDVHEMYDKSLQVEPREREDEKIVRYVQAREQRMAVAAGMPAGMLYGP
jgi:son of sevenless